MLEIGAGRGSLPKPWREQVRSYLAADVSEAMVRCIRPGPPSQSRAVFSGEAMPIRDGSVDVILSGLGDPYNTSDFWRECARCLAPDGEVIWTTPSFIWASRWRALSHEPAQAARFELIDGSIEYLKSIVLPAEAQARLVAAAGLRITEIVEVPARRARPIPRKVSQVLSDSEALVVGYRIGIHHT